MAYSLSNEYAKNLCKRTVLVQVIIKNVVTCFLEHSVGLRRSTQLTTSGRLPQFCHKK